ncbi:MAG: SBBP repeat-containing protein, partial [Bacteroidota bacterium]|nr:SBBP repeat-containing protein [Bacteroidota bacterium]
NIYIQKLNAAGNFIWAKSMIKNGGDEGTSIALDKSGNVYTTGFFQGTLDFDPGPGTFNLYNGGVYIQKLNTSGNFLWAKKVSAGGTPAITLDAAGNIYTTGGFSGTVDFDPGPGTFNLTTVTNSVYAQDIFVQKLDASGNFAWARSIGVKPDPNEPFTYSRSIAVDGSGNVYTAGEFGGTADFNPGAGTFNLVTNPSYLGDVFIQKLNAAGNFVWARRVGSTGQDEGADIAVDASGNIFTTGSFTSPGSFSYNVDFDPGAGTFNLTTDMKGAFITKWSQSSSPRVASNSISIASKGDLIATNKTSFGLYPNPTNGNFIITIKLYEDVNSNAIVQIYNAEGKLVTANNIAMVHGVLYKQINLSKTLAAGIYSVRVTVNDKIILQRQLIYQR